MLPLITVLEAPPPKSHTPVDEDTEEEAEEQEDKQVGVGLMVEGAGFYLFIVPATVCSLIYLYICTP